MCDYFICPHCGSDVPNGASSCPECGSDETTGWSVEAIYEGLGLGEPEYDSNDKANRPWPRYLFAAVTILTVSAFLASTGRWGIFLVPILWLGVGLSYYLAQRHSRGRSDQEARLIDRLRTHARGDEALVQRMIDYEKDRNPGADKVVHLQDALNRWQRDNR